MKKRFFKYLSLILLLMIIATKNIFAFSVTTSTDRFSDNLNYGVFLKKGDANNDKSEEVLICTDYYKIAPPTGTSCELTDDWSIAARYGVAAIINEAGTNLKNLTAPNSYYLAAEMAINVFLNQKGEGSTSLDSENLKDGYATNGTYYNIYEGYFDAANNAYNSLKDKKTENFITLSANSLTFRKDGDNYKSNEIEVTSIVGETYGVEITPNIGNVIKENNKFHIVVPVASIANTTNITVKVISNSFPQAMNYSCGNYQSVTSVDLGNELYDEDEISGTITVPKIIINKVDSNNVPLVGAKIVIKGENTRRSETFVTDGNPIVLIGWDYDTYFIEEDVAPEGYAKAPVQTVTISAANPEQAVTLVDNILKISILKVNEEGKVLPGATLKLTDDKGETLKICGQLKNSECRWKTTEEEYIIEKIPVGTYYIKEVSAPDTYDVSKDSIKVIVTSDGLVTINGKDIKGETIKFVNKQTRTEISKVSAVDGKELPGATIEILDANKEKMSCVILNNKGKKETLKECSWVSGEESTIIVGLSKGKYYMKETIAPEGYVLNEEMVEFEVKADGTVNKATMKNELEVVVPDTLSARSTLLIAISMFDIALGIGILTYVKKNKAEE